MPYGTNAVDHAREACQRLFRLAVACEHIGVVNQLTIVRLGLRSHAHLLFFVVDFAIEALRVGRAGSFATLAHHQNQIRLGIPVFSRQPRICAPSCGASAATSAATTYVGCHVSGGLHG